MADFFKLLFSSQGTIDRRQFFLGNVYLTVIYMARNFISAFMDSEEENAILAVALVLLLIFLALLYSHFVLCIKRLRELGKSGTWSLLIFLPPISLVLYYWTFFKKPE